jgi:hypothetical protein
MVRIFTRTSRLAMSARSSRACIDGMCTLGSEPMRQDERERVCASRLSVFTPRCPTPRLGARVAGTTVTSWLAFSAMSATATPPPSMRTRAVYRDLVDDGASHFIQTRWARRDLAQI